MTQQQSTPEQKTWLNYLNLSDHYERKARFLPALLSIMILLPVSASFGGPILEWLNLLVLGVGLSAAFAVGISHLASAAGNRVQKKLWPKWPHDSPTNLWLHPDDETRSFQQKTLWYKVIRDLTKLDIIEAKERGNNELEAIINDAVSTLRYKLRNSNHADRLNVHNADYGFARNFLGLSPFWLFFAVLSFLGCWVLYFFFDGGLIWGIVSTAVMLLAIFIVFSILPNYVRVKARHYAESFFGALIEMDEEKNKG